MTQRGMAWPRTRSNVAGIAWPPLRTGPAAALAALVRQLEDTQWLPSDEIAARQYRQLRIVAEHAARHSPRFGARMAAAKLTPADLATPDGLRQLPILRRRDIQSSGDTLFCREVPKSHLPLKECRTSGSTGEPVMVKRTGINVLFWAALTVRDHLWHRRDFGGRFAAVRAHVAAYREADSWGGPAAALFKTGPAQIIPISTDIKQQIALLTAFQPDNLLTYPNNLEALTRACARDGIRFPGLRHVRTIGETVSERLREDTRAAFGVPLEDIYSSEEFGVVAIQCPDSGLYHVMAESVIVEVLDGDGRPCGEGEIGALVITDLHNFATPLFRYRIADHAEVAGPCSCGRGLPTLKRFAGRTRNLIVTPDGRRYWPVFGFRKFRDIAPIQQYQVVQETVNLVEVRFVSETPVTPEQEAALRTLIQTSLEHPFEVKFTYFGGRIPRGTNGKFEEFISKVA